MTTNSNPNSSSELIISEGISPLNILTAKGAVSAFLLLCDAIPNAYLTPEQSEQFFTLKKFAQDRAQPLDLIEITSPSYSSQQVRVSLKESLTEVVQAIIASLQKHTIAPSGGINPPYNPTDPSSPTIPPLSLSGQELFWAAKAIATLAPLLTLMDFDNASSLSASQNAQTQIDILLQRVFTNNTNKIKDLRDHSNALYTSYVSVGAQIVQDSANEVQQVPLTGTIKATFDVTKHEPQYIELDGTVRKRADYPLVQQNFPYTGEELKLAKSTVRIPKQSNLSQALNQIVKSDLLVSERTAQSSLFHTFDFASPVLGGVTECGTLLCQSYAENDEVMIFASAHALYRKRKKFGMTEKNATASSLAPQNPHETNHTTLYEEGKLSESTATNTQLTANDNTYEWSRCNVQPVHAVFLNQYVSPFRKILSGEGFFVALDIFGHVYSSKDNGLNWKQSTLTDPQGGQWSHNGITSPQGICVDGTDVVITSPEYMWISRDGGDTFTNAYNLNVDPTAPAKKTGSTLIGRVAGYWVAYNPYGTMEDNRSPLFRQRRTLGEPPSPSESWEKVNDAAIDQWAISNPSSPTQYLYQMELVGNRLVLVPNGPNSNILTTQNGINFSPLGVNASPETTPTHSKEKALVHPDAAAPTLFNQSAPYYTLLHTGMTGLLVSPNQARLDSPLVPYAQKNIYFQVLPDTSQPTPEGQTTRPSTISIRQDDFIWNTTGINRTKNPNGLSYDDQKPERMYFTALYANGQRKQDVTYPLQYILRSPQTGTEEIQPYHIFSSSLNYYATIPTSLSLVVGYEATQASQAAARDFDGLYLNNSSSSKEVQMFPKQFPNIPVSASLADDEMADSWSVTTPLALGSDSSTGKYLPVRKTSAHTPNGNLTVVKHNNSPFAYVLGLGEESLFNEPNRIKAVPLTMRAEFQSSLLGLAWSSEIDKTPSLLEFSKTATTINHPFVSAVPIQEFSVLSTQKNTFPQIKTGADLGLTSANEAQTVGAVTHGLSVFCFNRSNQVIVVEKLFSSNLKASKLAINWTAALATNGMTPDLIMASNHSDLIAIYDPTAKAIYRARVGSTSIDVAMLINLAQLNTMPNVPYGQYITDIQYLNGKFVFVGAYGLIITSEDLISYKVYWAPDSRETGNRPPLFSKVGTVGRNLVAFPQMSTSSNWDSSYYYISYDNGESWYPVETLASQREGGKYTPIHIQDCGGHAKVWDAETWGVLIMNAQAFPNDLFRTPVFEGEGGVRKFMRAK